MRSLRGTVFYMKTNILEDFCICISAPLTGVEGGVKTLLVFDTSVWFTLPPRIQGEAILLNLWLCRKFAWSCWLKLSRGSSVTKKSCFITFCQPSLVFYLNFLFQLQLEKELLVDQDLIFQSRQILNWLKQRIWLVNFSSASFVKQKSSIFQLLASAFLSPKSGSSPSFYVSCACVWRNSATTCRASASFCWMEIQLNSLNAKVVIKKKPVNWFAKQINWLVSTWWQLWHLIS